MQKLIRNKVMWFMLTFAFSLLLGSSSYAQDRIVSGTIIDENEQTLPGVSVTVKGTTLGTVTDFEGKFKLSLPENATSLIFSFVGYKSQEVSIDNKTTFDISLEVNEKQLDEIVVVGYGVEKKAVVTGAISSVKTDDILQTPVLNAAQSLQGRTAGVQVTNVSGQPGAGIDIRIRGTGSNGNNSPLYVVDGVQMDNINYLNPNDIATFQVLKDAASSAIYGSRGANGVVLITTKEGKSGKMTVSYDGYYGVQQAANRADLMNAQQYMEFHNEGSVNAGNGEKWDLSNPPAANTDWQDEVFQNAPIQNHSLSLSGGSEKSTFMASIGYFAQDGIIGGDKSTYDRLSLRLNSNHKISNSFTFGQNLNFSRENRNGLLEQTEHEGAVTSMLLHDPVTPVYAPESDYAKYDAIVPAPVKSDDGRYYGMSDLNLQGITNPLGIIDNTNQENTYNNIVGNVYLNFQPKMIKGLNFKTDFGFQLGTSKSREYTPVSSLDQFTKKNSLSSVRQGQSQSTTWQWENTLSYTHDFGDHKITALIGNTAREHSNEWINGSGTELQFSGYQNAYLDNKVNNESQTNDGNRYLHRLVSYFGKANYNYKDKYLFTAILRYDGSVNFGPENRFALFPSLQAGWVMSEDLFKSSDIVNFMRLRASYGEVGNENIQPFAYLSTIGKTEEYMFNGQRYTGFAAQKMPNPAIKWETATEMNVGFDVGLWQNKFFLNVDLYDRRRKDLLSDNPIPLIYGIGAPTANIGTVQNKGFELTLNYKNSEGDFRYDISAIASYNDNKVLSIDGQDHILGYKPDFYDGQLAMKEGHSLPYFWGYKTDGILQNDAEAKAYNEALGKSAVAGDIRFVDTNGDGELNAADRTDIGDPFHDWTLGLNARFEYKNFDLSIFFQGQTGAKLFNVAALRLDAIGAGAHNYNTRFLDRWTGEGSTNSFPRWSHTAGDNFTLINDMVHLEDASYVRLKTLQFGYSLPQSVLSKAKIQNVRFYFSGNNLLTFTNYSGLDPEVGHGGTMGMGMDRGSYPQARSFIFGTNLTF
ncbi:SusC/RagA family TonB-linked outer membrane protein [Flammeovirga yaeyamensis]|uniref:SusC/RagA family TonB-linked outer membrane protein n=1 Tax=Flammeovirga yaeyamensis TaxID=367791 RepID=A0AAX1N936_9BACT|nr:TonB-dependent receptor [Flammeovirga yaeyamensis]MBB3701478.1 TonB-linked SusC/RagA family outer membrane protein [Flammeovirga yaeyamensis]NMF38602.1 TonB-dependent receptor [Flammeovirga yaeyamensis]QWG02735.1 SusC/RagA family TonB-linked outer membrane protein [Flammeovirga yaeyamensis]